jgi:hypothetical protein
LVPDGLRLTFIRRLRRRASSLTGDRSEVVQAIANKGEAG